MTTGRTTPDETETATTDELAALAHERIAEGHALLARAHRMCTTPPASGWLTLDAAGDIAGVRGRVIRDAGRRGEIAIDHAGRSPLVTRGELERWIVSRRRERTVDAVPALSPREAARAAVAARATRTA